MHKVISATLLLASATTAALAQVEPSRPALPAPEATAPFEAREGWCQGYAAWYVSSVPSRLTNPSTDVRDTQRIENEINYCKLDPKEYERQTRAELAQETTPG
ncbi:hypothetical protein [Terricaulis silvestris]|uniref:YARHG domain-containing protein n=1 Tax=Terricaulis silvestris TaxID=2686094 RepID=A0A6I6MI59_9CAUL|nr:hypothetical protein [Terricaulis silvestris]QGZ94725.1 hypothetical protein DSM104635_01555 [Terricaulis silvestris]